jgi:hypothetical protein
MPVPDAERLVDIAFFRTSEDASAVAAWCANLLATSRMTADSDGWHSFPVNNLPALLNAARAHLNVTFTPLDDIEPFSRGCRAVDDMSMPGVGAWRLEETKRRAWTRERVARLAFLAGQGWTAKQIAADPLVSATPNNVQRQANRFGILLSDGPQGQVALQLPIATTAVIDRAAASVNQTRGAFLRQWLIRCASDPARYGMVVISTGNLR